MRRAVLFLCSVLVASTTSAQTIDSATGPSIDPTPPQLPSTFIRGENGRSTIRAVRLTEPITLDGRLDEAIYESIRPASGFIQQEPLAGEAATEDTEVWIFFDDRNVYVSFRCTDSSPERLVANEMRRDNGNIFQNDNVTIALDTFYDRRTGFFFQTNVLGGLRDALILGENLTNYDWNTVWDVKTRRFERGWIVEMSIPFKSLRYPRTDKPVWGFNVRRAVRWKNEQSLLGPAPRSYGASGLQNLSFATTLVGIEPPPAARNIELKPAGISSVTTNRAGATPVSNELDGSFSLDAKYGITSSMMLDFTANTDFAQVEIDEQQVNLTRFNLLFPEKRDFFLEGQSIFDFAGSGGQLAAGNQGDTPILFFTRRIGLNEGRTVPIRAGVRASGRAGRLSVGVLDIGTGDKPEAGALATNFLVTRVKRDILRRSNVGLIMTHRTPSLTASDWNTVVGFDANMAFFQNVQFNSYYALNSTADLKAAAQERASYRSQVRYFADRYGLEMERMKVGKAFDPEVGFVRRRGITRSAVTARFSPRPQSLRGVRKVGWEVSYDRFVNVEGVLESRAVQGSFRTDFSSSDVLILNYNANYDLVDAPFNPGGVQVPIGVYQFNDVQATYTLGPQRVASGNISMRHGQFYGGHTTSMSYTGRVKISSQLAVEPRLSRDRITLPLGNTTTKLIGARTTYTISPRMFASALIQYNSSTNTIESNARLRWEYQPGSDLFIVYTDGRDTAGVRTAELVNRGLAIKFTRLLRF